ncbi:ROK family transcriptional regulator [soil metagenome]
MVIAPVATGVWPGLPETERRVLLELLLRGAQSRVRIAERLGLSRASLTRAARELLDGGFVTEGELEVSGHRGRPAESLRLRPEAAYFVGVKLTGDMCYVVLIDLAAHVLVARERRLPSRDVDDVVAVVAELVANIAPAGSWPAGLGVAVAGDVVVRDGVSRLEVSPFLGWNDVPLAGLLAKATGLRVSVANDVQALTGAHHWFDGLAQHRSLVVYGLGAGIGSGIVIQDELVTGTHGRSGRVGHTRIGGEGVPCAHGHLDCVHSFVTMPAIEGNAGVAPGEYELAVQRARAGGRRELEAFEPAARALGEIIAEAVNTLEPEIVSVLGEGRDLFDLAPAALRESLADHLERGDPDAVRIEVPPFDFGQYARGAAVTALRESLI